MRRKIKRLIIKLTKQDMKLPTISSSAYNNNLLKISHISAYSQGNGGDVLLPVALRSTVEQVASSNIKWGSFRVNTKSWKLFIDNANKSCGVIIGGGGLFLRDTNPNHYSGWQWSIPIESLKKIKTPLCILAVGYNRFRNQEDFDPIFRDHIKATFEKCCFVGLRNTGSINSIKEYLPNELHSKLRLQPCMTVILRNIYPHLFTFTDSCEPFIAVNCAFDRASLRFGNDQKGYLLRKLSNALKYLSSHIKIKYYAHMKDDEKFLHYLNCSKVPYEIVRLYDNINPTSMIEEYKKPSLVIGMRGHSQMIPFGCGTPILSVISHNKMQWFLDDIGHPEWGIEIRDSEMTEKLIKKALDILNNKNNIKSEIFSIQDKFYKLSENNIKDMCKSFLS